MYICDLIDDIAPLLCYLANATYSTYHFSPQKISQTCKYHFPLLLYTYPYSQYTKVITLIMFCIRQHIARPRYLVFRRFVQESTNESLLTPSFNVDDIQDLPYEDSINLSWKYMQPYKAKVSKLRPPVLFIHGLFGSILSFNKTGRALSEITRNPVYGVDLRNHGNSPHVLPFTYTIMAYDVYKFITERNWKNCILVGHSMGAKVAAIVSLLYPDIVSKLVLIDNTPHSKPLGMQFYKDLIGMCEVEAKANEFKEEDGINIKNFDAVSEFLAKYEPDDTARLLLVSNLLRSRKDFKDREHYNLKKEMFKVPVMNFYKYDILDTVAGWPKLSNVQKFDKPVMVISAKKSEFILPEYHEEFSKYFENITFKEMDCGHWIQAEKREELVEMLAEFIGKGIRVPIIRKKHNL